MYQAWKKKILFCCFYIMNSENFRLLEQVYISNLLKSLLKLYTFFQDSYKYVQSFFVQKVIEYWQIVKMHIKTKICQKYVKTKICTIYYSYKMYMNIRYPDKRSTDKRSRNGRPTKLLLILWCVKLRLAYYKINLRVHFLKNGVLKLKRW